MSKILSAVRKSAPAADGPAARLEVLGFPQLFPLPGERQNAEFRNLANLLLSRANTTRGLIVTFASTTAGEGSSYVSFNVARSLASLVDRKVAWVDANFQSPQPKLAGREPGLSELLVDPRHLSHVSALGNLAIVPNGSARIKITDALRNANFDQLLDSFRANFFCTILDAAPVANAVETVHVADRSDGLVLVVESGRLKYEVIQSGLRSLTEHGVSIIGTVLNRRVLPIPGVLYHRI